MPTVELIAEVNLLKRRLAEQEAQLATMRVALETMRRDGLGEGGINFRVLYYIDLLNAALATDSGKAEAEVIAAAVEWWRDVEAADPNEDDPRWSIYLVSLHAAVTVMLKEMGAR